MQLNTQCEIKWCGKLVNASNITQLKQHIYGGFHGGQPCADPGGIPDKESMEQRRNLKGKARHMLGCNAGNPVDSVFNVLTI